MDTILRFATTELEPDKEMTYYNHIFYKIKTVNTYGITYLKETFDDVSPFPYFEVGNLKDGKFNHIASGDGEAVPDDKFSCGGAFVEITIHRTNSLVRATLNKAQADEQETINRIFKAF